MIVALTALAVVAPIAAPSGAADELERALDRMVGHPALRGARVGVAVADLATGEVVLERQAERGLVPASSQKLLTAAAALARFGPAHRFVTRVYASGELGADGVLDGALWVVGSGDPSLVSESLWRLAQDLRLLGIREVRGGIGIDARAFDRRSTHEDWEPVSRRAYHSPTAAFAANYSSFRIDAVPDATAGKPARVTVVPDIDYFRPRSDAVSVSGRGNVGLDLQGLPDGSGERVRLTGTVPIGRTPRTYWRAVASPERYAAAVLREQMTVHGIRVSGPVRLAALPDGAVWLMDFAGDPLALILRNQNKYSNNFIAEQLTKALGAAASGEPGSWSNGTRAIRDLLLRDGAIDPGTVIADGSGLSPRNRVSPASLVRLIRVASSRFGSGPEFLSSLPLGGIDGTLEDREYSAATPVRGKTGHLRRVASLAGVVPGPAGRLRSYAVMVNGHRGDRTGVDAAIDQFVASLARAGDTPLAGAR